MKSSTIIPQAAALLFFLACNGAHAELSPKINDAGVKQSGLATASYSQNARGLKRSSRAGDHQKTLVLSENSTVQIGDRRGQRPDYTPLRDGAIQARPRGR